MARTNESNITTSGNRDRHTEYADMDRQTARQIAEILLIIGSLYAILFALMF